MPVVTACHLEIGTEFKHEYILGVEIIRKNNYKPCVRGYRVGDVAYFLRLYLATMSVEPTLKKI